MTTDQLGKLSERELLELLGLELVKGDSAAFPFAPERLIHIAEDWLARNREVLCSLVCSDSRLQQFCRHQNVEDAILVGHIAVLLSHQLEVETSIVAVLLVRRGLNALCRTQWKD